jgi:pyridoxamine 5'-phosphate oxidase
MRNIADIRKDYMLQSLEESEVAQDPIEQFERWWDQAINAGIDEINAMTLATVSMTGAPSARMVLLKGYDENGFVFFTNYESRKGDELAKNPQVCLVFFWKELERQIRIEGIASKLSEGDSDAYFHSRPESSRIGAWVSPQSRIIAGREVLDEMQRETEEKFNGKQIPRPPHWGGYLVKPISIEFWQGRPSRLHDRLLYSIDESGIWKIERLAP